MRIGSGRLLVAVGTLAVAAGLAFAPAGAAPLVELPHRAPSPVSTYVNPVSRSFADTFADPSVIRGKDGLWYAFGTSDPLREGERTPHRLPIARSSDLVTWSHVADAFDPTTMPTWAAPDAALWAPDIRYVDGQYRLYYVVTQTTVTDESNDNAIGMATAPTPLGPWTDSGAPVVGPRHGGGGSGDFLWTFDPSAVTDRDGSQWLFYGSYYGGIHVAPLSPDGRRVLGASRMVAVDNKFEGAYVIQHGGYWFLFASTANCCAGPTTGYSVQVGRSVDLRGPYVDQQGVPLLQSRAGGTPVLVQNGNRWVGTGHNAVVTDLAGQDWAAYHAIDVADPFLDEPYGINQRPMLLDRLDWVQGWPTVRSGRGPSDDVERGPVAQPPGPAVGPRPGRRDSASWVVGTDRQSGAMFSSVGAGTLVSSRVVGAARTEADLRSTGQVYGLTLSRGAAAEVRLAIDPATRSATLTQRHAGGPSRSVRAALPAGFDASAWHSVSLEVRDGARAEISHARLGDPVVVLSLPASLLGTAGSAGAAFAGGAGVDVDNLSTVPAANPVTTAATTDVPNRLDPAAGDEFSGAAPAPGWSWVRRDAAATVSGGALRWPTEAADLTGDSDDAGVLLRDLGDGDWTAATKLTIDLGTDSVRNFQQGGLIAYVDDDLFARLSHVAIWNTRQTEFGKEMPYAGRLSYGGTIIGPPADTTWLRLTHHRDPETGEHALRGWTSTDGRTWVEGGVWTLPAGARLRVGLVSHGGAGATAAFDWFRVYRS
jgi:hypothetical protein